jgi:hypothetical protein
VSDTFSVADLHAHLRDSNAVDLDGMFARRPDGSIVFVKGKYKGQPSPLGKSP